MPNLANPCVFRYLQGVIGSSWSILPPFYSSKRGQLGIFLFREDPLHRTGQTRVVIGLCLPNCRANATLECTPFLTVFTKFEGLMSQLPLWHGKDLPSGYRYRQLFDMEPICSKMSIPSAQQLSGLIPAYSRSRCRIQPSGGSVRTETTARSPTLPPCWLR